jgi:hypothetical protein
MYCSFHNTTGGVVVYACVYDVLIHVYVLY